MSAFGADCGWKLMGQSANGEAVRAALTRHSQIVCHGALCFEFAKTRTPCGDIVLTSRALFRHAAHLIDVEEV